MQASSRSPSYSRSLIFLGLLLAGLLLVGFAPFVRAAQDFPTSPETFDGTSLPSGWTVVNASSNDPYPIDSPYPLPNDRHGWRFDNPGARQNLTGGTGNFALADSDHAGRGETMDTQLRTPTFSLQGVAAAYLEFNTDFRPYDASTGDVDLSIDGGQTWTNIWRTTLSVQGQVKVTLPASALNQTKVKLRFRYYNATWDKYWAIDNVAIVPVDRPTPPDGLQATLKGSEIQLNWNAASNVRRYVIERSPDGTNWATITEVLDQKSFTDQQGLFCGIPYRYRLLARNLAGLSEPSATVTVTTASCDRPTTLNEDFTATTLPSGWTMTPSSGATWLLNNPNGRTNQTGGTGNFALAESRQMDASLVSPLLNLSDQTSVELQFKTFFRVDQRATAEVDVSTDGGSTWVNVWRQTSSFQGSVTLDLSSQLASKSAALVRFRYSNTNDDWYWQVDDVQLLAMSPPVVPTNLRGSLLTSGDVSLTWDGRGSQTFELERALGSSGSFQKIATLEQGVTSFVDKTVTSETLYRYRVRSRNAVGFSAYSNIASLTSGNRNVRMIDITVSYYANSTTAQARRQAIEQNLRYFADSIYEMSNGANKLRRVTIYTGGSFANQADIVWVASCWPNAHLAGYGTPGLRIQHCDTFQTTNLTINFMNNDREFRQGGYVLGHEMGHYFYSVYDEYRGTSPSTAWIGFPRLTDTPVDNSVMNSQWNAVDGNFNWLNFSTALNNTGNTAQHRVYASSAWQTLARPLHQDPRNDARMTSPVRLFHPELAAVAPASGQPPRIDLTNAAAQANARNALQFVWVGQSGSPRLQQANAEMALQFVVDTSTQMSEAQLASIKANLKNLVDQASDTTMIGLITYADTVTVVQQPVLLDSEASRTALKATLDGLVLSSSAAVVTGEALETALGAEGAAGIPDNAVRAVYLFSAGMYTGASHPFAQVGAYQDAAVTLEAFDLGRDPQLAAELFQLATATGGDYVSVADATELRIGLREATHRLSPVVDVGIATGSGEMTNATPYEASFYVDASLGTLDLDVIFSGLPADATITLTRPDGTASGAIFTASGVDDGFGGQFTLASTRITNPALGTWTLRVTTTSARSRVAFWADGTPQADEGTFFAHVRSLTGNTIAAPEALLIDAMVAQDFPITGGGIRGEITLPDGTTVPVVFTDDGVAPDFLANDGHYSALIDYRGNGVYSIAAFFDNDNGQAVFTEEAVAPSTAPDGTVREAQTYPVEGNFQRYATTKVFVTGWQPDDHADDMFAATQMSPDNTPFDGRIDRVGDVDIFKVDVPADYSDALILRIGQLALGMDPVITAFDTDETWSIDRSLTGATGDMISVSLPNSSGTTVYIAVKHRNAAATTGLYELSVGPLLANEVPGNLDSKGAEHAIFLPMLRVPAQGIPNAAHAVYLPLTLR
ncbi:choice-of-anchor J domain-containing protein [Candidatus Chloroploca sp. M-50]|uniref:Choice-of-anchor J domain-containing protein n=1 Tax=Candidatus Chloroploca mongolica TaxID=2528176 RepID=A0ABS4D4X5_9CHLR|nr:choice-of-anchor J domain-containing protein [Candidatus Chloroploca mongolica]MBP1464491.1 choice-of-anchor J domain-containing protein [Candidatus Chloroploca mongolica]